MGFREIEFELTFKFWNMRYGRQMQSLDIIKNETEIWMS